MIPQIHDSMTLTELLQKCGDKKIIIMKSQEQSSKNYVILTIFCPLKLHVESLL